MNTIVSNVRSRQGTAVRALLLLGLAACLLCFFSGCSNVMGEATEIVLSYHAGNPEQSVPMECTLQEESEASGKTYVCADLDPQMFSEQGTMYLEIDKNEFSKIKVECDDREISLQDGFYPIDVEKNAQVVITHEYQFFFLHKPIATYSFSFRTEKVARISDISYSLDNGWDTQDIMMLDFDPNTQTHTVDKKIPYNTLELVINAVPEDEEFEIVYSPSRRIFIESEEGKECQVAVLVTVTDPKGEYQENTYRLDFTVEEKPARVIKPKNTQAPSPTPTDSGEPVASETPMPTETSVPVATATPSPKATPAPKVTTSPTATPAVIPESTATPEVTAIPTPMVTIAPEVTAMPAPIVPPLPQETSSVIQEPAY